MRREAIAVAGALAYFFGLLWAVGGQEPIKLDGNVEVVKVPTVVTVLTDRTVVKSLPVRLIAPTGGLLYRWRWPAGVKAVELSNVLEVTEAPKGEVSFSVQWAVIDFEKKLVAEKAGQVAFYVGEVKPPDPPKPPEPPTPPAPITEPGFRVMVIYEATQQTAALTAVSKSKVVWDYLDAKCAKDEGNPARRFYDKDVGPSQEFSYKWERDMFALPRTSVPWLIISNGTAGFTGPLPATADATLELLRKYGG